ncbi:MAG: hypothetical protein PWQ38_441, partial [Proteiniphilum sp.]|nr:hypothetical protein [Proteiniphilum sp.]
HSRIVHRLLKISQPLLHIATVTTSVPKGMRGNLRLQSPSVQHFSRLIHPLRLDPSRWGKDHCSVILFEGGGSFHLLSRGCCLCIDIGIGGILLDKFAPRSHLFTHQHGEDDIRIGGILNGYLFQ